MKQKTCAWLAGIALFLCACSPVEDAGQRPAPEPTETALALGITADNYPAIDGSTSTLGIAQEIYRAMFGAKSAGVPADASKTVPSYHFLMDGHADMILVPYASADILAAAEEKGLTLEFYRIAAEALIFITSAENPATTITTEQVRSIYLEDAIRSWSEIGGPDKALVPICRNADSGSQSQMDNLILHGEPMHRRIAKNHVELTMEGMLEQVAFYHYGGLDDSPTESYALGYTLYAYLKSMNDMTGIGERLKVLSFDGIVPDEESLTDGSYALTDGYYAVIRSDLPEDHSARAVIGWLQGDGARIVEALGLIPAA